MKPQHVIYLTGHGAVLYTWDEQRYVPVSGYDLPKGDPTAVVNYLRQTPAAIVAILVDVIEEEHHSDTIPRLRRRDQDALLSRRVARTFPRTPYRTAVVQGRSRDDSQASKVLLSGLTKPDHLRDLQALLAEAKLPLATVCSPALLSRPLLDKLRPASPADATLIVSRQREGNLRLSFFRGRDLLGSRLMRRSLAAPPGDIARLVQQLEESVRYFDAAFTPSASNPVDVLLLCELDATPAETTALGTGHDGFRLHMPDPVAAARKLGLGTSYRSGLPPGNADVLFVELLRRYAPTGNFAPPADRRYFHQHQILLFGRAASVAIAVAGMVGASLNAVAVVESRQEVQEVRTSVAELTQLLQADVGEAGGNGTDPLGMQQAVTAWRELNLREIKPGTLLDLVSAALEGQPRVQLDGIKWSPVTPISVSTDDGESENAELASATPSESGFNEAGAEEPPASPDEGQAFGPGSAPRVRVSLSGRIEPFDGDYRQAFAELQSFIGALQADGRVLSVTARKEPLDVSPRSTLTGEVNPTLRNDQATFTVDLLVRLTDGPA